MNHIRLPYSRIKGTMTSDGFIPYLERNGLSMPVALQMPSTHAPVEVWKSPMQPEVAHDGSLLYVTPSGGRVKA